MNLRIVTVSMITLVCYKCVLSVSQVHYNHLVAKEGAGELGEAVLGLVDEGDSEGVRVGVAEGAKEGVLDGITVGKNVGLALDGRRVGRREGAADGNGVGVNACEIENRRKTLECCLLVDHIHYLRRDQKCVV